jgi:hypothetical protein
VIGASKASKEETNGAAGGCGRCARNSTRNEPFETAHIRRKRDYARTEGDEEL